MIPFTKMHGAGNDFIVIDAVGSPIEISPHLAQKLCDRRFGIGADQILIARESSNADFTMQIINADGGTVEMCGNGIRCFAKFVRDKGLTTKDHLVVDTLAGLIRPQMMLDHPQNGPQTQWVKVDMGEPILEGREIPVNSDGLVLHHSLHVPSLDQTFSITCVSMGNPHCVVYVDDVQNFPVEKIGPEIENHPFFPNRVNTEFIQVTNRDHQLMRVWERGSGETLACGTGACASVVASILHQKTNREVTVSLKGGDLVIHWDEDTNRVWMTGPAATVFEGVWNF